MQASYLQPPTTDISDTIRLITLCFARSAVLSWYSLIILSNRQDRIEIPFQ